MKFLPSLTQKFIPKNHINYGRKMSIKSLFSYLNNLSHMCIFFNCESLKIWITEFEANFSQNVKKWRQINFFFLFHFFPMWLTQYDSSTNVVHRSIGKIKWDSTFTVSNSLVFIRVKYSSNFMILYYSFRTKRHKI